MIQSKKPMLWFFAVCLGLFILHLVAYDSVAANNPGDKTQKPQVVLGEYAPDFNLPRLTITTNAEGQAVGLIDPNRSFHLAAQRGKKPVCLIMSSYT